MKKNRKTLLHGQWLANLKKKQKHSDSDPFFPLIIIINQFKLFSDKLQ